MILSPLRYLGPTPTKRVPARVTPRAVTATIADQRPKNLLISREKIDPPSLAAGVWTGF